VGKKPVKIWKVKSQSQVHPDTGEPVYWNVELWSNKRWDCDCPAVGKHRKKPKYCYHIKDKIAELIEKYGSVQEAIKSFRAEKNDG